MGRYSKHELLVAEIVEKYADILGDVTMSPDVVIVDRLAERWLGRTTWSPKRPDTTTIEIQASVLGDHRTLERVLAHEMVHHWEMTHMTPVDLAMLKHRMRLPAHGEKFRQGAARVNAAAGDGFVTTTSDQSYVKAESKKPYYLLLVPTFGYISREESVRRPLGYAWAVKIGDQARFKVEKVLAQGGKLVRTTNPSFTRGPKIQRFGGVSIPDAGTEDAAEIARLFTEGEPAGF